MLSSSPLAQEESRSISKLQMGHPQRFQSGEIGVANKRILVRYDEVQKRYLIVQRKPNRWVGFKCILTTSPSGDADRLNRAGIRTIADTLQEPRTALIFNEFYAGYETAGMLHSDPIKKTR